MALNVENKIKEACDALVGSFTKISMAANSLTLDIVATESAVVNFGSAAETTINQSGQFADTGPNTVAGAVKMSNPLGEGIGIITKTQDALNALGDDFIKAGENAVGDFNKSVVSLADSIKGKFLNSILETFPSLMKYKDEISKITDALGGALVDGASVAIPIIEEIGKGLQFVGGIIKDVASFPDILIEGFQQLGEVGRQAVAQFEQGFIEKWDAVKESVVGLIPEGIRSFFTENFPSLGEFASGIVENFERGFGKKWDAIKEGIFNLIPDGLKNFFAENIPSISSFLDIGKLGSDAIGFFADGMGSMLGKIFDVSSAIGGAMTNTIGGAISILGQGFGGLKDFAVSALSQITQSLLSQAGSFLSGAGGLLSGIFGGGGGSFLGDIAGGLLGSFFGGPGRANGGSVFSGTPVLVGEKGPELFLPPSNGKIIPNNQMGGGENVTIVQNISTGQSQTIRAEMMAFLPVFVDQAKHAIADARQRDPRFSAQMGV